WHREFDHGMRSLAQPSRNGTSKHGGFPPRHSGDDHDPPPVRSAGAFTRRRGTISMHGLIMERQLLIIDILRHAMRNHPRVEIVSQRPEGGRHRYTYADAWARVCRLARVLERLGARPGDRVGTMAWNTHRHFELYYATAGAGTVCHTVNPRLFPDQLAYVINHAGDRWLFVDTSFVPIVEQLAPRLSTVEAVVVLCDRERMPDTDLANVLCYEDLLADEADDYPWPELDERT